MTGRTWARIWFAAAILAGLFVAVPFGAASSKSPFRRGATLVEFFQFPATTGAGATKTYADPAYPHALSSLGLFDFDQLRRMGFDHMRVPLDVGPLMRGDRRQRNEIITALTTVVTEINRHGLAVVVPLFPPSLQHELPETYLDGLDGEKFQAYFAAVESVTLALNSIHGGLVALEAMNEPQDKCRIFFGTDWTVYQEYMVEHIRGIAPDLPLFLTGGCWSDIEGIVLLQSKLVRDPHNFISVHFYRPFLFTHQGSTWTTSYAKGTIGVPYPATAGNADGTLTLTRSRFSSLAPTADFDPVASERKAETEIRKYFSGSQGPAQIEEWMNKLSDWQQHQHVASEQIVFTEFGAMKEIIAGVQFDPASRARWLHDTASAIERHGWGWTVFVLRDDPFGLYVHEGDSEPDLQLMRALGLDMPSHQGR